MKHIGIAFFDKGLFCGRRPIYEYREIKRGRHKGKAEVVYRAPGNVFRKMVLSKDVIELND